MKNIIVNSLFVAFSLSAVMVNNATAQDIHFSQFYEHGMLRNPALTGIFAGDLRVAMDYKSQWASIGNVYKTVLVTAESKALLQKESKDVLNYGIAISYDKAGSIDFKSLQILPAINYSKALGDNHLGFLSVGFSGGYVQRSVDASKMTFANQYFGGSYSANNPTGENINTESINFWDLSAGVSFNSSLGRRNRTNYILGLAAYHVTTPKLTFDSLGILVNQGVKWSGQLGFSSLLAPKWGMNFHLNVNYQQPYKEIIFGGFARYMNLNPYDPAGSYSLYAGVFYRYGDAIIPAVKLAYMNYSATISYDVNNSTLNSATNGAGGFEITLALRSFFKKEVNRTECPRFDDSFLYMED